VDAVIENLVLESDNLMPNILEIEADNFFRFGRRAISSRRQHRITIHASQIQCNLKDVAYWIRKKQGFPSLTDTGLMDIFLGGEGLSFYMKVSNALEQDRNRIFKVDDVKVSVKNLKINLRRSKHKIMFAIFRPFLMGLVKPAVAKAAEVQIRRSFDRLDEQLWLIQNEYNKAKAEAKDQSPEDNVGMGKMYWQAIQKRISEIRAKKTPPETTVQISHYISRLIADECHNNAR
jgi:Family of unknown function (DUF5923)/Protein of unknown function (DUF4449)